MKDKTHICDVCMVVVSVVVNKLMRTSMIDGSVVLGGFSNGDFVAVI